MVPVIRISDQTYAWLQRHAKPFEDKPEDVIIKGLQALDMLNGAVPPDDGDPVADAEQDAGKEKRLTQQELRIPLLTAMIMLGGEAKVGQIRQSLHAIVASQLSEADLKPVKSGDPRWWNAACWERKRLVEEGLFASDSPRGTWKLTARGRQHAEQA